MKQVNVLIPVHNRPEHTRQTLKSLYMNTPADLYDAYIIDDESDSETKGVIASFNFANIFVHHTAIGPGACRNELADYITKTSLRHPFLYESDNDVYFKEGWLPTLIKAYKKVNETIAAGKLKVLGGSCHPYLQNKTAFSFQLDDGQMYRIGIKDAVSGYSQLMTWETWDEFGPFDESMRNAPEKIMGSEDWAFCQKIIKAGWLVGSMEPEVIIPCGKTNTYGKPATGSETFKEHEGVKIL